MSDKWASDSNVTIEVLQRVLTIIEQQKGTLPSKLCLQMDNCARENKNQYVLAYLSWLVQRQVFQEVELSFLPVGHTHEDIDQLFSRLAVYLRGHDAIDRTMLYAGIQKAFHQYGLAPVCYHLDTVANLREFFKPHLKEIGGQTERDILHYTFRPHANGAYMLTKSKAIVAWDIYGDYSSGDYGFHLIKTSIPNPPFAPNDRPGACAPKTPHLSTGSNPEDETAKEIGKGLITLQEDCRVSRIQLQSLRNDLADFKNREPVPFNWPNDGQFACERARMERLRMSLPVGGPIARWSIAPAAAAQSLSSSSMLERDRANLMDGQMLHMLSNSASRAAAAAMSIPTTAGAAAAAAGSLKRGTLRDKDDIKEWNKNMSHESQVRRLFPTVLQNGYFIVLRPSTSVNSSAASSSAAAAATVRKNTKKRPTVAAPPSGSGKPERERDFWLGKVIKYRPEDGHIMYQDFTPYMSNEGLQRNVKTSDAYEGFYSGDVENKKPVINWHRWHEDDMWTFFTADGMSATGKLLPAVRTHLYQIIQSPPPIRPPLDIDEALVEEPTSPWATEHQPEDNKPEEVARPQRKGGRAAASAPQETAAPKAKSKAKSNAKSKKKSQKQAAAAPSSESEASDSE